MKTIKEKPSGGKPRTVETAKIPKAAMKQAWLVAKEKAASQIKESTGTVEKGEYTAAADTGEKGIEMTAQGSGQAVSLAYKAGRKLAERTAERREQTKAAGIVKEQAAEQPPNHFRTGETTEAAQGRRSAPVPRDSRQAGQRPDAAAHRATGHTRPAKPGRAPKSGTPVPKTGQAVHTGENARRIAEIRRHSVQAQAGQKAQQAAQAAIHSAQRVKNAVRSAAKAATEALNSFATAIAAGGSIAVGIMVLVCFIALVAGSAYGIFFAAEAPREGSVTVQQAVEQLNSEYRDYLQEIESAIQHDRQEIQANDDVYYIRWQDVLAVFASYVSGAEDGSPVAVLDERQIERLRQTMWDMNEVNYSTYTETVEIEPEGNGEDADADNSEKPTETENQENEENGSESQSAAAETVTQTVLLIQLNHRTPEEMSAAYHFTNRQQEYLTLLLAPECESLWAELLGGFVQGSGEILAPADGRQGTGPLQWPLPIAGHITSPFGYRTDPISGETSYHSGTDIAAPNGTPILAAANGTVVVANGVDSWGSSYGYYIKIDHRGGLQTLYAHCQSICVTTGQQVQAGQVIGYVGSTGRSTGNHLHFEIVENGQRRGTSFYFASYQLVLPQ